MKTNSEVTEKIVKAGAVLKKDVTKSIREIVQVMRLIRDLNREKN